MVRIDPDIAKAHTLPAAVYRDPAYFALQQERVFAPAWHYVGDARRLKAPGHVLPFTLLEGCLDEPLVLTRDRQGTLHCLSNVCTHRGMIVVEGEGHLNTLRCRYHGRRFGLDGCFLSMPEFDGVETFPSERDDLPHVRLESWGPFLFASLDPAVPFDDWIEPMRSRVGFLPLDEFVFDPTTSHDYLIQANWALYCDNYLEGFHIPYVHAALNDVLDYGGYRTETFAWQSLQLGVGKSGEDVFELPAGHPDEGTPVAAYYFWLFPNLMFNFYPWGLSLNVVQPLGVERTKVSFLSFVWKHELRRRGAGYDIHRVELEDEEVVEAVQRGVKSRLYDRGRYSATREQGTHHFHRLLAGAMGGRGT
ncbi:MAG TPA: aromatic ring-hydroxylating dioxygenase subunit alpha [Longimicrobiales bacterium]